MIGEAEFLAEGYGQVARASAPGRLDVMGGVADYSGSLLLQMPIAERTSVAMRRAPGTTVGVYSTHGGGSWASCESYLLREAADVARERSGPSAFAGFRQSLRAAGVPPWADYVLGCLVLGAARAGCALAAVRIYVDSEVPVGQGLSSSAALEVATLRALTAMHEVDLGGVELAVLAQAVENEVVGAPCGLMDQLASHLGVGASLLPLRCEPRVWVGEPIALPQNLHFTRHPSGVEHAVAGDAYGRARCAAFMGSRIMEVELGVDCGGVLAELDAVDFRERLAARLPVECSGADFTARYGDTADALTTVEPSVGYPVRAATAHPILEHERIEAFAKTLREAGDAGRDLSTAELRALGGSMLASHHSYSAIGLGHPTTDELVSELLGREGIYGARVTGGGVGGSVVALAATQ